jgi:hypothetical protein
MLISKSFPYRISTNSVKRLMGNNKNLFMILCKLYLLWINMDVNGNIANIFWNSFISTFNVIYETVYRIHGQDYLGGKTIVKNKNKL